LSGYWIDLVHGRRPPRGIVLRLAVIRGIPVRVPFLSHHIHSPQLAHRSATVELRGAFERMQV
jgi:hypothetical protein